MQGDPSVFDPNQPDAFTLDRWIEPYATDSGRIAFVIPAGPVDYPRLARGVQATAQSLAESGVTNGDRVVFCGLNRVEQFELLFACARLRAVLVPINNRLTAHEVAVQLADCEPSLLVATDGFASLLAGAATEVGLDAPVRDLDRDPVTLPPGSSWDSSPLALSEARPDDAVLMVYTSGTTGQPKGAMLSQRAVAYTVANSLDHQGIEPDDVILSVLPAFHVGGINIQVMPALAVGATVVLPPRFDPAATLADIAEHRPTHTVFVPAVLDAVAAQEQFASTDLSCLVGINSGSSVVPRASMAPWFARGVPVGQVYGTTETGPTSVVLRFDEAEAHQGSAGRPARHSEVRIAGASGAVEAAPVDMAGEILLRGPNLFNGYWRNPSATAEAFDNGWYRTGDVGHLDAEGFLHVHDRVRDLYITGGENVYPAEVEAVLVEHPGVAEVAVVGRPDRRWGEIGVAVVVPAAGGQTPTVDELRSWCEGRLARFKQPRELVLVESLPRTALGKVRKHVVRDLLDEGRR